jgi:hypothetical protein
MAGVRRGARSVLKWFSPLMVVLIVIQVFLAGEGIFGLANIKNSDDCDKGVAHCVANAKTLDAHRALGFIITNPLALLFLICALLAWHPNTRLRTISIVVPILTFIQMILAGAGRWAGGLHPVNAMLVLGLYGYLAYQLRQPQEETVAEVSPVTVPTG